MRILLANDDGFGAPGLKCLETIARTISSDIWIVAPDSDKSGASHSLSLDVPLRYSQLAGQMFSVAGTPTDCVLLALLELIPPPKPDLILAGVNAGANLGDDVTYSGTVAAAMEGSLHKIPAIALSQNMLKSAPLNWQPAEQYGAMVIKRLLSVGWPLHVVINVKDDMDVAQSVFSKLGFTTTPRGYHTLGSINHLMMFGTDYMELIGFPKDGVVNNPDTRPDLTTAPFGINGLVFKPSSSRRCRILEIARHSLSLIHI